MASAAAADEYKGHSRWRCIMVMYEQHSSLYWMSLTSRRCWFRDRWHPSHFSLEESLFANILPSSKTEHKKDTSHKSEKSLENISHQKIFQVGAIGKILSASLFGRPLALDGGKWPSFVVLTADSHFTCFLLVNFNVNSLI